MAVSSGHVRPGNVTTLNHLEGRRLTGTTAIVASVQHAKVVDQNPRVSQGALCHVPELLLARRPAGDLQGGNSDIKMKVASSLSLGRHERGRVLQVPFSLVVLRLK